MQEPTENNSSTNPYRTVGLVLSLSLHFLVLGLLGLSCLTRKEPPPPPLIDVELLESLGGGDLQGPQTPEPPRPEPPRPEPPKPEPPRPEPPKPEPPKPEPPKPEPPKPEPPKPEPPKPEPPKPEPPKPEPPKVEKPKAESPKPKKPEKPKTPSLEERLREAKVTPPKNQPSAPKPKDSLDKQLQERLQRSTDTLSRSTISAPSRSSGNPNPGLRGAQLNAYETYLVSCLQPPMQPLWDQLGPEGLSNVPRPVRVTLTISPSGKVLDGTIRTPSDSALMNSAAKTLLQKMLGMSLPPFSKVGLPTQGSLQFEVDLNYSRGNTR